MVFKIFVLSGYLLLGPSGEQRVDLTPQIFNDENDCDLSQWVKTCMDLTTTTADKPIKLIATLSDESIKVLGFLPDDFEQPQTETSSTNE